MYKEQKTKLLEFIRFGIVGTLAVGVHYGLFYVLLPYMEKNLDELAEVPYMERNLDGLAEVPISEIPYLEEG